MDHQGKLDESHVGALLARYRTESKDSDDWDYIREDEINDKDDEGFKDDEDLGIELDEKDNAKLLLLCHEMNGLGHRRFSVIGHGDPNIAKRRDSLNCQPLMYDSDRQAPPRSFESFQRLGRWQIQADG